MSSIAFIATWDHSNYFLKNGGITMSYRIQLNMKTQEFIAIDSSNAKHIGKGNTIEKALQQLKK